MRKYGWTVNPALVVRSAMLCETLKNGLCWPKWLHRFICPCDTFYLRTFLCLLFLSACARCSTYSGGPTARELCHDAANIRHNDIFMVNPFHIERKTLWFPQEKNKHTKKNEYNRDNNGTENLRFCTKLLLPHHLIHAVAEYWRIKKTKRKKKNRCFMSWRLHCDECRWWRASCSFHIQHLSSVWASSKYMHRK